MQTKALYQRTTIIAILILQLVPLILLPPSSFTPDSQEWWLPALLMVFALVALVQLVFRHSDASWPWDLTGFAQGFNIISRLMLLMPHATVIADKNIIFNTLYVVLSVLSMLLSAFMLWYIGKPEVRNELLRD